MSVMASLITGVSIIYSLNMCSGADQRKHQSSPSLAFAWGIHRWPVNSPHKRPVKRKMFHLMTSSWTIFHTPAKPLNLPRDSSGTGEPRGFKCANWTPLCRPCIVITVPKATRLTHFFPFLATKRTGKPVHQEQSFVVLCCVLFIL